MSNKKYIGIDIGGTAVKIGLVTEDGTIGQEQTFSVNFDGYETPILETVIKSSQKFLGDLEISTEEIAGIGVSATGSVDTKNGVIAGSAGHIKNWEGSRIREEMEAQFQTPVYVLNDANAAALGEMWLGAAKGKQDVIVMTVGTGIGGGVIVNSKVLLGASGFGGEIGHSTIMCEGETCSCGNQGCLEHYGSTTALVRQVKKAVEAGEFPELQAKEINGKVIFELAKNGNQKMLALLDRWMDYLSAGLVGLVHIFNPELILIGGGVSAQKKLFIEPLQEKVCKKVMPSFAKNLTLKAAELKNDAGLVGAVYYCMQQEAAK